MTRTDDAGERYLRQLRKELRDVPRAAREEIVEDVEAHLGEAADAAELRTLIDRLGDPAEIAAEARERFGVPARRRTWVEIGAVILLPIGGVVLPLVGWVIGVVLLWSSRVWTVRDKLIGTLVVPGGLAAALWMVGAATTVSSGACQSTAVQAGKAPSVTTCTDSGGGANPWLVALLIFLIVAPLVSAAYLAWRTSRLTQAGAAHDARPVSSGA